MSDHFKSQPTDETRTENELFSPLSFVNVSSLTLETQTRLFPLAICPTKLVLMYVTGGVISRCLPGESVRFIDHSTRLQLPRRKVDGQWFIGQSLAAGDVLIPLRYNGIEPRLMNWVIGWMIEWGGDRKETRMVCLSVVLGFVCWG